MWVSYRVALFVIGKQCYWNLKWYLSILESNSLPSRVFLSPSRSFPILQLKINLGSFLFSSPPISETPTGIDRSTLPSNQTKHPRCQSGKGTTDNCTFGGPAPQPLK
nr:putative protein [Neurospora crassa]